MIINNTNHFKEIKERLIYEKSIHADAVFNYCSAIPL